MLTWNRTSLLLALVLVCLLVAALGGGWSWDDAALG